MKFTDKFVLLPIERYERLMKSNCFEGDKTKEIKENELRLQQEGGGKEKQDTEEKEDIKSKRDKFDENKDSKAEEVEEEKTQESEGEKDYTTKIPPPPPGIPNKIKKEDFKWIVLFK